MLILALFFVIFFFLVINLKLLHFRGLLSSLSSRLLFCSDIVRTSAGNERALNTNYTRRMYVDVKQTVAVIIYR